MEVLVKRVVIYALYLNHFIQYVIHEKIAGSHHERTKISC